MGKTRLLALACALLGLLGCGSPERRSEPSELADEADATVMFVDIEGPLDELRSLRGIDGIVLERGAGRSASGRYHVGAYVSRRSALRALSSRAVTVRVVMDEAEARRRMAAEREAFERDARSD